MNQTAKHQPVMLPEAVAFLNVQPAKWYVDATFGRGGHTREILKRGGKVIAFDVDDSAIKYGQHVFKLEIEAGQLRLIRENFDKLSQHVPKPVAGILFDFGTSVDQLTDETHGFSFDSDTPLDMRMDTRLGVTAADLLKVLPEKQLAELFIEYGGEAQARGIAKAIVREREAGHPVETTAQLVSLIDKVKRHTREKLHPATKVFQALRIAVNTEMEVINAALPQAWQSLLPGGRLVTLAFHEGEDRPVKHQFKAWAETGVGHLLTEKPLTPTETEVRSNPSARSAKLRAIEKIK